jgi:signal peptidase I
MTRSAALRPALASAGLVLLLGAAWLLFAPTRIGGSTDYVTTHGDSMAPRFHTGDLALIRRAEHYRIGDVVAYRDTLLHAVVLHRIIARDGDRYVFKGDHNDFVDPTRPGHADLIGRLWQRVPRGGVLLAWLRVPTIAATLSGGAALFLLSSGRRRRPHRDRHRRTGDPPMHDSHSRPLPMMDARTRTTAWAMAAGAFLLLAAVAFSRPETKRVTVKTPYVEKVSVGYHANAAGSGPVYRRGAVRTGDPVFLRLVDRLQLTVGYRLSAAAPHRLAGSIELLARLTSPTGWSRRLRLTSPTRFRGDHAGSQATLDLRRLRSLISRVESLSGAPSGGDYTFTVVPRVDVAGTLGGRRLSSRFAPALSFQLDALQLRPGSGATGPDGQENGLTPTRRGNVTAPSTTSNRLAVHGHGPSVAVARWIALPGLLAAVAGCLVGMLRELRRRSDPTAQVEARYGHLIVPVAGTVHSAARPPIDVTNIAALAQLAERSGRLILRHQHDDISSYLVDDGGTVYRYETRPAASTTPRPMPLRGRPGES